MRNFPGLGTSPEISKVLGICCCCCCYVASVLSDSVWPHRWQPTRLPRTWDSPGKSTGVGCHVLLQCMKVKSESEVTQLCLTLSHPWTAAHQASPSVGFSRQEYWSGLPFPSPPGYIIGMNSRFVSSSWQLIKPRERWLCGRTLGSRALNFRQRKT